MGETCSQLISTAGVPTVLAAFKAQLESLDTVDAANVLASIKAVQKETGIKGKNLWMPIRVAVSGVVHGPELPETVEILGKEKALAHLDQVM